jgi:hypothetical protein
LSICQPTTPGWLPNFFAISFTMRFVYLRRIGELEQPCLREPCWKRVPSSHSTSVSSLRKVSHEGGVAEGVHITV